MYRTQLRSTHPRDSVRPLYTFVTKGTHCLVLPRELAERMEDGTAWDLTAVSID